jgi:hypothetical protein
MAFELDFGNLFGGNTTTGLNALLNADQRRLMNQQGNLSAAAALLAASGPSRQRVGLGQALGSALQAGQQGYQQARSGSLQELMLAEKLKEAQRNSALDANYLRMVEDAMKPPTPAAPVAPGLAAPGPTDYPVVPLQVGTSDYLQGPAPVAQVVPQAPAAAPAAPNMLAGLTPTQLALMRSLPRAEGLKFAAEALKPQETVGEPFRGVDGQVYLRTKTGGVIPAPVAPQAKPVGTPQQVMGPAGKPQLVQYYDDGTYQAISGVSPLIAPERIDTGGGILIQDPFAVRSGTVIPKTLAPQVVGSAEDGYFAIGGAGGGAGRGGATRPPAPAAGTAPATQPSPTAPSAATGPVPIIPGTGKSFTREKDLRTEYTNAMKPFTDLSQAFNKVEAAALNPSAAGDISMVYGYMKILDPGSTVMQGEQATASNAGGIPDRVRAMYNKALTGQTLAPDVRNDFYAQSRNLIESQRQMQQDIAARYTSIATQNNLNPNQVVFDPFQRIKTPAQIAADSAKEKDKKKQPSYQNRYNLLPRNQ